MGSVDKRARREIFVFMSDKRIQGEAQKLHGEDEIDR